jgi:hypothetical protein
MDVIVAITSHLENKVEFKNKMRDFIHIMEVSKWQENIRLS